MWELYNNLLGNPLPLYLYSPLKTALFSHFSHRILGGLLRLVWSQRSSSACFIFAAAGVSRSIQEVGVYQPLPGWELEFRVNAEAEAPTGVALALLYIVRGSPPFCINHTSHSTIPIITSYRSDLAHSLHNVHT